MTILSKEELKKIEAKVNENKSIIKDRIAEKRKGCRC